MLLNANALNVPLADDSVHCAVTSPPYWNLRDYETEGQLGNEALHDCLGWATGAPCGECFICRMVNVFAEVRRVLRPDGTCWVNMGDSYASKPTSNGKSFRRDRAKVAPIRKRKFIGLKEKDACMMPARLAMALQADGWYLRSEIVWHKPNPMPSSVDDRVTVSHEMIYLLAKSKDYYYDLDAIREPVTGNTHSRGTKLSPPKELANYLAGNGKKDWVAKTPNPAIDRNKRSVWTIPTYSYPGAHYATYPPALVEPCVLAGTSARGVCVKCGSPWTRIVEILGKRKQSWHDHQNDDVLGQRGQPMPDEYERRTLGWKPGCKCGCAETAPAIVFDPFCGSGTTGQVALELGRRFVGQDLSMKYLIENATPRLASVPIAMQLTV